MGRPNEKLIDDLVDVGQGGESGPLQQEERVLPMSRSKSLGGREKRIEGNAAQGWFCAMSSDGYGESVPLMRWRTCGRATDMQRARFDT